MEIDNKSPNRTFLVRVTIPNKDKANLTFKDKASALKFIGKTEEQIDQIVEWLNITDYFFKFTQTYIRETKN